MYNQFNWTEIAKRRNVLTRVYEPIQPFLILEMARAAQSNVFIDIGANIGLYSVFLSSLDSISRVIAFEASPDTFREMSLVFESNELGGKAESYNLAVSDCSDLLQFGIISEYSGANSIIATTIHGSDKFRHTIPVRAVRLDDILCLRDKRLCLKIDVEGHEEAVLVGARSTLESNRCIIQIENYRDEASAVKKLLKFGFHVCFNVGPDVYLTNDPSFRNPEQYLRIFEAASEMLIQNALAEFSSRPKIPPIRRRVPGGVAVEFDGRLAAIIRKLAKLMGKTS